MLTPLHRLGHSLDLVRLSCKELLTIYIIVFGIVGVMVVMVLATGVKAVVAGRRMTVHGERIRHFVSLCFTSLAYFPSLWQSICLTAL